MLVFKMDKEAEPKIKQYSNKNKKTMNKHGFIPTYLLIIISLATYGEYNLHCALSLNEAT